MINLPGQAPPRPMVGLGLTGGMGMGKSTIARMLVELGCQHWDADAEIAEGYGWNEISMLDRRYYYEDGKAPLVPMIEKLLPEAVVRHPEHDLQIVDRKMLRSAIERDPDLLSRIEDVAGPWLLRNAEGVCRALTICGPPLKWAPFLFDAPLWFEPLLKRLPGTNEGNVVADAICRMTKNLHFVVSTHFKPTLTIVVSCPPEVQRQRCFARPGMTEEKFNLLISRQLSDEERRDRADFVIDTDRPLDDVRARVEAILTEIKLRHC
jgi:dephospho-CoA kinase